jgi:hypothetical protein
MGLFDSGMQLISEQQYLTDKDATANELIGFLAQQTQALIDKASMTLEQVRGILADKSRSGKTAEVRAIIKKYGADRLSDIDPKDYPKVLKAAEVL